MKRYNIWGGSYEMARADNGKYVKYSDVEPLIKIVEDIKMNFLEAHINHVTDSDLGTRIHKWKNGGK